MNLILYYLLPAVSYIIMFFSKKLRIDKNNLGFLFIVVPLSLIFSFYGSVNDFIRDFDGYQDIFSQINQKGWESFGNVYGEYGYILANAIFLEYSDNYLLFRFLYLFVAFVLVLNLTINKSIDSPLSIFFFMSFMFYVEVIVLPALSP